MTHPQFVRQSCEYINLKRMGGVKGIGSLVSMPVGFVERTMKSYKNISSGQVYCGVNMSLYKKPSADLLMSSFDKFNAHNSSFQTLPWIVNLSGVGVWAQSGAGSESFMSFDMANTHNPLVQQRGSMLLATYAT